MQGEQISIKAKEILHKTIKLRVIFIKKYFRILLLFSKK